jgi:adenine-specific DNA-methyltransferase
MTDIEKMDLKSVDIAEEKRSRLKELFPEVFTEGRKIDFERLKLTLGETVDAGKERYGMNWPGKADCFKIIQQPSIATLTPAREESVNFDETENLFIEGDNLEVLKLLQKSYFGKVKMICIDPPYNTGNDFIYPDNYSESLDTYLRYTGQIDNEGRKYSTNTEADGRFHSKWMSMMYPRLFLARNLLRDDGVIFVSIDDNEVHNLRLLMNEVFGEENFVGNFLWHRRQRADSRNQSNVSTDHEYVVAYSKSENAIQKGVNIDIDKYENPDNDPRGNWASIDLSGLATAAQRPNLHYDIIDPKTGNVYPPNPTRGWSKSKENVQNMIEEGRILFPKNPSGRPREKKFLADLLTTITGFSTCLDSKVVGYTTNGTREVTNIFKGKYFDFPKPSTLIKSFVDQSTSKDKQDIILDFFAGSCTTAHAVFHQNSEDTGNRKFIMVQLPEPCIPESEAFKAGYKTIADIGKERIRRVIKKIQEEQEQKKDLFSADKPRPDLGFKVFKLEPSNFKLWNDQIVKEKDAIKNQLEMFVEHINPQSSQEDILYELLLKSGFPLTTKIEQLPLADKSVFSIDEGGMLICLEKDLTPEVIKAMAEKKPSRVVCLDEGFHGNDQLKTNAVQIMKAREIIFRTI